MIHSNRQARAATQSRVFAVVAVAIVAFVAVALAAGTAAVEFRFPVKGAAMLAVTAVVFAVYKARERSASS